MDLPISFTEVVRATEAIAERPIGFARVVEVPVHFVDLPIGFTIKDYSIGSIVEANPINFPDSTETGCLIWSYSISNLSFLESLV